MMDINKVNVGGHFTHLILTHFLSSFDWFDHLESLLCPHVGNLATALFCFPLGFLQQTLTSVDFGQRKVKSTRNPPKILISLIRIFWHYFRGKTLTLTFHCWPSCCCCFHWPLTDSIDFWVDFWVDCLVVLEGCVTLLVGWPYWYFVGWSILLTVVMHQHTYIFLACLLSIFWYVLSAFYFIVYVIVVWYWKKK